MCPVIIIMCPYKTVLPFGSFLAVLSPLHHHKKFWNSGKIPGYTHPALFLGWGEWLGINALKNKTTNTNFSHDFCPWLYPWQVTWTVVYCSILGPPGNKNTGVFIVFVVELPDVSSSRRSAEACPTGSFCFTPGCFVTSKKTAYWDGVPEWCVF